MDHEQFEILIQKQLCAAASAAEESELAAHLAECQPCRRELEETRRVDAALKIDATMVDARFSEADWDRMHRVVVNRTSRRWVTWLAAAVAAALVAVVLNLAAGRPAYDQLETVLLWLIMPVVLLRPSRAKRALAEASRGNRLALVEEIRQQKIDLLKVSVTSALGLAGCAAALWIAGEKPFAHHVAGLLGVLAALACAASVRVVVELRDLSRKAER
jgi:hypothetical protein